jgi:hypothetical protein
MKVTKTAEYTLGNDAGVFVDEDGLRLPLGSLGDVFFPGFPAGQKIRATVTVELLGPEPKPETAAEAALRLAGHAVGKALARVARGVG